jgi:type II secretory ATPase GspE/PulE/Tfp pilus assembly ATPase PilB-like protein
VESNIFIDMVNGAQIEAEWAREFNPADREIAVLVVGRKDKSIFDLSRICCIRMSEPPYQNMVPGELDPLQVIETVTGKSYSVRSLKAHQDPHGFFAVPVGENAPDKMIYFTNGCIRCRQSYMPVGKILENQGILSREDLDKALSEQRRLKSRRLGEILSEEQQLEHDMIDEIISQAQQEGKVGKWLRVGDILVGAGLVTREQVENALASQKEGKKKQIGQLLVELGLVTEEQVLAALATKFHIPFVDLAKIEPDQRALSAFSVDLIMQLQVFPVADRGDYLEVATSKPTEPSISDNLRFHTNRRIKLLTATPLQIRDAIARYYAADGDMLQQLVADLDEEDLHLIETKETLDESDSGTIRLVNRILIDAYQQRASDIHLEPGSPQMPLGIRYRIDGICKTIHMLPSRFAKPLISRLKILASVDIAEHRKAQSGKILMQFQGKRIEYRLEIIPSVGGNEDAVLRVLTYSAPMTLDEIDLSPANLKELKDIISKPYGIVLCVGPTGSGKTTTLHAALAYINTPERKIWTVEDPVEITQAGLRQVEIKEKVGLTYMEALRSLLRADPDVVMIGEMRDRQAAHTAIETSMTGHLVFSTLHTNSAAETITRLIEMGEETFNLADTLLGIVAQRLARKFCSLCKEDYHPDREEYDRLREYYGPELFKSHGLPEYDESFTLSRGLGCSECGGSGYKGRVAVHELMVCSDSVRQAIKAGGAVRDIREIAVAEGMRTLRMDGVEKVLAGRTDLQQIQRVCL